ncbi:MAG: tyrosine-type recombinase/integrase [Chloroflexota bacterium]
MPASEMTITQSGHTILLDGIANKDQVSRMQLFVDWLLLTSGNWQAPDLGAYRDWLLSSERLARDRHTRTLKPAAALSPASAAAHLSTVRGRYQAILDDNGARDNLYAVAPQDASASDRKAFVDETLTRLENAIKPGKSTVKVIQVQDSADSAHLRLTLEQANALLAAPFDARHNTPLQAVRDTALIALLLCTGMRDSELCDLDTGDLRQQFGGALALQVREGKGGKARLIPYGNLDWCLIYVEKWLQLAGISSGAVFRGFYKGGQRVRAGRLTMRAVQDILDRYPISIDGALRACNPHDLRRTYARRLHDAGVPLLAIQQNLGHQDSRTTEGYIGVLDAGQRRPPALYKPPHLKRLESLTLGG